MPAPRWAALAISVVAGACVTLAGCSGSSSSPGSSNGSHSPAAAGPNVPAGINTSPPAPNPATGQLTGSFCKDFRNVSAEVRLPADATGSLSDLRKNGVPALNHIAVYFDNLAAEAPGKAGQELRVIAADYKAMAASIQSGKTSSISQAVSQVENLTTSGSSGTAFRQLIAYMLTKCVGIS